MQNETKESLYMLLDLLDSIDKTSKSTNLLNIDRDRLNVVKSEIFNLMSESENDKTNKNIKTDLIGIIPSVLLDEKNFPTIESIAKFAEKSMNIELMFWDKRKKAEVIGRLITEINKKNEEELILFWNAWRKFLIRGKDAKQQTFKKDFVDVWLEFFENFKGGN
jgi:hypothetical protein